MTKVRSLILRRMRVPLLILIASYSISILGFVLIPGVDDNGQRWSMNFLDAVYFVSYMSTTIGFGELPYTFNAAQRIWTIVAIYLSVISWLYAIGTILTLVQDKRLKRAVEEGRFKRSVDRLGEPFYIICGYGETASLLVHSLEIRGIRTVVVDNNDDRIQVICRAESTDTEANMKSFNTDHIINPFDRFAARLAMALHSPSMYIIHQWLTGIPGTHLTDPAIPSHGMWVLCGYGRFGKAVDRYLTFEGDTTKIIEADHDRTRPPEGSIKGRGTEAVTLRRAGIKDAVGIVAGTDNDTNNLSIIFTAKEQNEKLFLVARQNKRGNEALFRKAGVDIIMERSDIIAHEILALILTPMLSEFLAEVRHHGNEWTCELASRLIAVVGDTTPDTWTITVNEEEAPAILERTGPNRSVTTRDLLVDHRFVLENNDQILFCAREGVRKHVEWTVSNRNVLRYVQTGVVTPDGSVWRWLHKRQQARRETA
jgi:Trk K+ transport system NAD-binding subunit